VPGNGEDVGWLDTLVVQTVHIDLVSTDLCGPFALGDTNWVPGDTTWVPEDTIQFFETVSD